MKQTAVSVWLREFDRTDREHLSIACCSDVLQQVLRKHIIDHHEASLEVCSNASQAGAILGGIKLEIGIRKNSWRTSERHRTNKRCHQRYALRHDKNNRVALPGAIDAHLPSYRSCQSAKFSEGDTLNVILAPP